MSINSLLIPKTQTKNSAKRYERLLKSVASFKPEASGSASTPTATAAEGDDQDSTGGTPVKKTPKKRAAAKSASKKTPTKRAKKSNNNGGEGDGEKGDGKKGDGKKGDNGDDTPATPASNKKKATPARKRAPAKKAPVAVKSQEIVKNETDSELSDPPPEVPYKSVNNEEGNDNNGACMKVEEKDNDTDGEIFCLYSSRLCNTNQHSAYRPSRHVLELRNLCILSCCTYIECDSSWHRQTQGGGQAGGRRRGRVRRRRIQSLAGRKGKNRM